MNEKAYNTQTVIFTFGIDRICLLSSDNLYKAYTNRGNDG